MSLIEMALTHKSYAHENCVDDNQRLEFLGDSIVNMIVACYLFHRYPNNSEGFLTHARSNITKNTELSRASIRAGLNKRIKLGKGAIQNGECNQPNVLADCFEAYVAALYLEKGLEAATNFVMNHIDKSLVREGEDPKTKVQNYFQSKGKTVQYYTTFEGLPHERVYTCHLLVDGKMTAQGSGTSKKYSEKDAASNALLAIEKV